MVGRAEMKALAGWCAENGVRLISDEIYHGIVYEGDTVSAVEVSDDAIVVNSFSKYFSMTGWRVGWLVRAAGAGAADRAAGAELLHLRADAQPACRAGGLRLHATSSTAMSAVTAATATCCWPACPRRASTACAGRGRVLPLLRRRPSSPTTAAISASACCSEAGVATTPGVDFDRARGAGTLRISFAGSTRRDGGGGAAAQGVEAGMRTLARLSSCCAMRGGACRSRRAARASIAPRPPAPSSARSAGTASWPRPIASWRRLTPRCSTS